MKKDMKEKHGVVDPRAVATLGNVYIEDESGIAMMKAAGMEYETPCKPANMEALMTPIEKSHQGGGPGWNTKRPKAGK